MNSTIQAIYEHGVIRLLETTSLSEGEELEIMLLKRRKPDAAKILSVIAELEIEGEDDNFSGQDHDKILYSTK
jgi:predicted DNA-binding antitoxin AbrB/MazE fold protein